MPQAIFVLGHKNPDSDSICSAIGYATLLQAQGQTAVVAARQGAVRRETAYILDRFGQPAPLLVTDVRPRVADVMTSPAITVAPGQLALRSRPDLAARGYPRRACGGRRRPAGAA